MKSIILAGYLLLVSNIMAQVVKDYDPSIQRTTRLQYFKPAEAHLFSGDCMPYYDKGTFYLYWLLDEGHHSGLGGLGGHQWALSTSRDLIHWQHYPVAVGIDEEWEKSICTGSVIADRDKFYAFYATRVKEHDKVHEQLSYAVSTDGGISYKKQQPNPFYFPPEVCQTWDFRDPKVFKDADGVFHLFISGYLKEPQLSGFGGYLVHLVSANLKDWKEIESPLTGQSGTPECTDYFRWGDWYYLVYSTGSNTHYVKSKAPYGPWEYPESQTLIESWGNVFKTAEFTGGRRIAVAFIPGKRNNKDADGEVFGGNILFRELTQQKDGTLESRFLPEVLPAMKSIPTPPVQIASSETASAGNGEIRMTASGSVGVASISGLPENYRITMDIIPEGNYDELGLFLRAEDKDRKGYKLELNPNRESVLLQSTSIQSVKDLRSPLRLDIIVKDEFFDVCVNNKRCIINRLPEQKGRSLFFYVKNGSAVIRDIRMYELTATDEAQ
ncbi:MAG: family 43 glycosylhydrolase [Tannerella sp.]|jgi:hypothetical protein|nr:family 43 glycosylhydrolase [Tannerella sp.]